MDRRWRDTLLHCTNRGHLRRGPSPWSVAETALLGRLSTAFCCIGWTPPSGAVTSILRRAEWIARRSPPYPWKGFSSRRARRLLADVDTEGEHLSRPASGGSEVRMNERPATDPLAGSGSGHGKQWLALNGEDSTSWRGRGSALPATPWRKLQNYGDGIGISTRSAGRRRGGLLFRRYAEERDQGLIPLNPRHRRTSAAPRRPFSRISTGGCPDGFGDRRQKYSWNCRFGGAASCVSPRAAAFDRVVEMASFRKHHDLLKFRADRILTATL